MNAPYLPKAGLVNELLGDIARLIQLPPSDYRLAEKHYESLYGHLRQEGGPLRSVVRRVYPQGSVAIGAVISSKFDNDEFDVDAVVELGLPAGTPPGFVLDTLFGAINGPTGSLYHGKVKRRTRCITVDYDRMHVDLTPAVLLPEQPERTSQIFHGHERQPASSHYHVVANPWGFAQWFEQQQPSAHFFADFVLRKSLEPLPDADHLDEKSGPLIALQLLKRWRNKCYSTRGDIRMPPSVLLSYFAGTTRSLKRDLLGELTALAETLIGAFALAIGQKQKIDVRNPACQLDKFSDRWPGTFSDQQLFYSDLLSLRAELAQLATSPTLEQCNQVLSRLFGERATTRVVEGFSKRFAASAAVNQLHQHLGTGAIALGASRIGRPAQPTPTILAPRNTNFGSLRDGKC